MNITLTDKQCKELQPLWDKANTLPYGWVILAQVHPTAGWMSVNLIPEQTASKIADALKEWNGTLEAQP
jgi:hypothetical protein